MPAGSTYSQSNELIDFPLHRIMSGLLRDPAREFERIGAESDGRIGRLKLGPFQPYLITHPDHVRHVLRDNVANYPRTGMMWEPFSRLVGTGIAGEGQGWAVSRKIMQPIFAGRHIASITDDMGRIIAREVEDLDRRNTGGPVDITRELTRVVHAVIVKTFFGDRLSLENMDVIGDAVTTATQTFVSRMLMPGVPQWFPMPGDRKFMRSSRTLSELVRPAIAEARLGGDEQQDIVSLLVRARDEQGRGLTDEQIRDDLMGMFVAGSESTSIALSWVWVVLDAHPEIAGRVLEEIDRVVGGETPGHRHMSELRYTRRVLDEVLRLHSVAWVVPRQVAKDDVIDGVPVPGGSTVIISPWLTHRLPELWPDPGVFDPDRFLPENVRSRHRFAYLPFGAGPHMCLGSNFFMVEALLIVTAMLQRFRPVLHSPPPDPMVRLTLKPRQNVELVLNGVR